MCPGYCGNISRNAYVYSSSCIVYKGISPEIIREKSVGINYDIDVQVFLVPLGQRKQINSVHPWTHSTLILTSVHNKLTVFEALGGNDSLY